MLATLPVAGPITVGRAARRDGGGLALLVALRGRTSPDRLAWIDHRGAVSWADLAAAMRRSADRTTGPVTVVAARDQRQVVIDVLAAMSVGATALVVPARAGQAGLAAAHRLAAATNAGVRRRWGGLVSFTTSGSTGAPRRVPGRRSAAVLLQYAGLLGALPVPRRPLVAGLAPVDHGHGFGLLAATWALGGTFVAPGVDPGAVLRGLDRIDLLSGVPRQLADLATSVERDGGTWWPPVGLVLSGSDVLDDRTAGHLERVLGAPVADAYGATEVGTVCVATSRERAAARTGVGTTVGRPLPGVRIRVLDESGAVVPAGVVGALEVRSPVGGRTPFLGDRGLIGPDRLVRVLGRGDGTLVSGGETVDPAALLAWLLRLPGVRAAHVDQVGDARFGHRLVADLETDGSVRLDPEELRERIRTDLGPAHTPRTVTVRRG